MSGPGPRSPDGTMLAPPRQRIQKKTDGKVRSTPVVAIDGAERGNITVTSTVVTNISTQSPPNTPPQIVTTIQTNANASEPLMSPTSPGVDTKKPLALLDRAANSVAFDVWPFSLEFKEEMLEREWRKQTAVGSFNESVRTLFWAAALTIAIGIATDGVLYGDHSSEYLVKIVLGAAALLLCSTLLLLRAFCRTHHADHWARGSVQNSAALVLVLSVACWSVSTLFENETVQRQTHSGAVLALLVGLHTAGHLLLFTRLFVSTLLSAAAYMACAVIFKPDFESWSVTIAQMLFVLCGAVLLIANAHSQERVSKMHYMASLQQQLLQKEKNALKKELFDMSQNLYMLSMQHHGIIDLDEKQQIDLKSPLEQAMAKLQALQKKKNLNPRDMFKDIQDVITLLGTSNDLFKPQIEKQMQRKNINMDNDTERFLYDLVSGDQGQGAEREAKVESKEAKESKLAVPTADSESVPVSQSGSRSGSVHVTVNTAGNASSSGNSSATTTTAAGTSSSSSTAAHSGSSSAHGTHSTHGMASHGSSGTGTPDHTLTIRATPDRNLNMTMMLPGQIGGQGPLGQPKSKEERAFQEMLDMLEDWNFDVFRVNKLTDGKPLYFLGTALFKKYGLIPYFKIDRQKLRNFLTAVEDGYHDDAPYHNSTHAADVARTVHFFLWQGKLRECMTELEALGSLVAAFVHDYDHPGRTNAFHIAVRDPKAILYNDRAVLENHHCAQAFFLLQKPENDIFSTITGKDYNTLRRTIVELVLATDLGQHFDFLGQFKSTALDKQQEKPRLMMMKMALKCADLGHSAKELPLHEKWTARITEEFYRQGDEERKRSIPISPFMDRQKANVAQAQLGFMNFLVIWTKFLGLENTPCMQQVYSNRDHWKKLTEANAPELTAGKTGEASGTASFKDKGADRVPASPSHGAPSNAPPSLLSAPSTRKLASHASRETNLSVGGSSSAGQHHQQGTTATVTTITTTTVSTASSERKS